MMKVSKTSPVSRLPPHPHTQQNPSLKPWSGRPGLPSPSFLASEAPAQSEAH